MKSALLGTLSIIIGASTFPGCSTPTEPSTPSTRYYLVASEGSFGTTDGSATILELQQVLDGVEATPSVFPAPVAQVRVAARLDPAVHGHHTLSIRVTSQGQSPATYRATGVVVKLVESCVSLHNPCPVVASLTLPEATATLRQGGVMTMGFDI